ncbi:hypothetical protein CVS40_6692 [Lucilia cuprina]|nr:hypothetical protein CVS40_6692 [Lucilia cuprina]
MFRPELATNAAIYFLRVMLPQKRFYIAYLKSLHILLKDKIKEDYDPKIHTKVIYRECLKVTQNVNVGKQRKCIQLPTTYLPMNSHTHISTYLQTNIPLNKKTDTPFAGNCLLLQVNTTIFHNFYEKQVRNYICGLNPNSRGE